MCCSGRFSVWESRSGEGNAENLSLSRLSLYINALYATCQDPRHFHGRDLIRELRYRVDTALRSNFSLPIVFLPLCFAGEMTYTDLWNLTTMFKNHKNRTDLQAIELMAMSCIIELESYVRQQTTVKAFLEIYTSQYPSLIGSADIYTKALAFQAMNYGDTKINVSTLLLHQQSSGSFGDLLATYYVIPALLGKNLLALKHRWEYGCKQSSGRFVDAPLLEISKTPKVYYSIWIGEGVEQDTHTVAVTAFPNRTFFDVMNIAVDKNPLFRFRYDEVEGIGKVVYSLASMPNDVEREFYWMLHLSKEGRIRPKRLKPLDEGVDKISVLQGDHFVFWLKRRTSQNCHSYLC